MSKPRKLQDKDRTVCLPVQVPTDPNRRRVVRAWAACLLLWSVLVLFVRVVVFPLKGW